MKLVERVTMLVVRRLGFRAKNYSETISMILFKKSLLLMYLVTVRTQSSLASDAVS